MRALERESEEGITVLDAFRGLGKMPLSQQPYIQNWVAELVAYTGMDGGEALAVVAAVCAWMCWREDATEPIPVEILDESSPELRTPSEREVSTTVGTGSYVAVSCTAMSLLVTLIILGLLFLIRWIQ